MDLNKPVISTEDDGKFPTTPLLKLMDNGVVVVIGRTDHMASVSKEMGMCIDTKIPQYVVSVCKGDAMHFQSIPVSMVLELKTIECFSDWIIGCIKEACDLDWSAETEGEDDDDE